MPAKQRRTKGEFFENTRRVLKQSEFSVKIKVEQQQQETRTESRDSEQTDRQNWKKSQLWHQIYNAGENHQSLQQKKTFFINYF